MEKRKLPTISELIGDKVQAYKDDALMVLLNQEPPAKWVKVHPYIRNYKYVPIDKVEYLLKKIFKAYRIEVKETKTMLNTIGVTVRVHYKSPINGDWLFHDGVGAAEIQTQKNTGSLKLDMTNINKGAVMMALPIAKTIAVKDACDHFGKLFGADLNRKDTLNYSLDEKLKNEIDIDIIKKGVSND